MQLLDNLSSLLRKPFPQIESRINYFVIVGIISVFVTLILYRFQPSEIWRLESGRFLACVGFGAITFVTSFVFDIAVRAIFGDRATPENITLGKWIAYMIVLMLLISIANFFYTGFLHGDINMASISELLLGTFVVGIFPTVLIGTITLLRLEGKYKHIAAEINGKPAEEVQSIVTDAQVIFDIPVSQIRYMEALQNYVRMGYVDTEGQPASKTERATLKGILDEIGGNSIVRSHRSYLVNRAAILSSTGNAQGLTLTLEGCERLIPVSRSYVPSFR